MGRLAEINAEHSALADQPRKQHGHIDPRIVAQQISNLKLLYPELTEDEDGWLLSLESETELHAILSQIVDRMQDASSMAGAIAERIVALSLRQERIERREKAMRKLALDLLQAAQVKKMELAEATLSVLKPRERVMINDEGSVPDDLCRIKRAPDMTKIKEAIADGASFNWAAVTMGDPSLSVRVK